MKKTPPAPTPRPTLNTPAETEPGMGLGTAAAIYFALALLYFLPAFLPGRHIFGTDYTQSSYFYYDFISQRTAEGRLAQWVPYVYGGVPLFSNAGSTFYPLRWVADFLLPTTKFFPLLFWFQFGVAGVGMYLLARELGCRKWVAFVAGLAYQWTGILTSWVYAGHDGRIIVGTFVPLFFYFIHRGVRTASLAPFAGLAATTGFVLLSFQIQNAYYLLLAGGIWAVYCLVRLREGRSAAALAKAAALGVLAIGFGFVVASVNFLPFLDYVAASPRGATGGRGYEFSTSFSMPARAILGLAVPEQVGATIQNEAGEYVFPVYRGENGFRLHTEYVGATVLLLVALGAYYARRNRYFWFFGGLGFFFLTLSLGGNTPLYRLYWSVLPGLKRFRAPDLAYFILAFSLVAMAALALERLAEVRAAAARRRPGAAEEGDSPRMVTTIVAGVVVLAVLGAGVLGASSAAMAEGTVGLTPAMGWMRFALFAAAAGAVLWAWMGERLTATGALIALSLVTTADLWVMGKKFFQTVPGPEEMYAADDVVGFLQSQQAQGPFRVWPLPQQSNWPPLRNYPMHFGIEQAGGEHGNQLQRYNQFVGAGEQVFVDWHNLGADPRFLDADNVRFLITSAPIEGVPFLREVHRGSALVYENANALPRAWLVGEAIEVADPDSTLAALQSPRWDPRRNAVVETARPLGLPATPLQGGARVTRHEPDEVTVATEANRPALLVLADNMYHGWTATVDGRPAEVYRTNHTFRGVVVPAGRHEVRFRFHSAELHTGFAIYLASLGLLGAYGLFLLVRSRRRRPVEAEPAAAAG
ncbi:MAG TPA: YfhO family protein [Longimicrobium sp.]|nr:YfhO family protein [Longimicrobium sp.]